MRRRITGLPSKSIEQGVRDARATIDARASKLKARARVIQQHSRAGESVEARARGAPRIAAARLQALGPVSERILVAEGDSWFDYPWTDVLELLDDDYGFEVESVAHKGDRIEQMAYDGSQLDDFIRRIEKIARRNLVPEAILLSGGGNDVAGQEFAVMLNHAKSDSPGLSGAIASAIIDTRLRDAYAKILSAVSEVCRHHFGDALPIIIHGYDYPVPDGRGFLGGAWFLPGPWLDPGFRERGYDNLTADDKTKRKAIMETLMNRFNEMLARLVAVAEFKHVRYVDLRRTLSTGANYKTFWANELHPTPVGFKLVTKKIADAISAPPVLAKVKAVRAKVGVRVQRSKAEKTSRVSARARKVSPGK